ncbi:hypothetical protein TEA_024037 [Camellia sinensis var. sinensis]|uniref:EF-hand domain-containing protein n=1 Tax=Camellia sinensis var. sinensis TaxID=542762 RepID=A0A4S4E0F0_CAMSN|nr:hypothetical protein TEA_024037 [Camellia sinensis var. sinensis]
MDASFSRRGATDAWMDAENEVEDYRRYIPLLNAALRGDWDSAERFFDQDPRALTAHITDGKDTALHVAIRSGRSIEFVKKLVDLMPPEALALRNSSGCTALISAALYGNTKAAVIVVEKHDTSLYIRKDQNSLPLHCAANNGHKDTLLYLLSVTKEDDPVSKPFAYPSGALLLLQVIDSEFYGVISFNSLKRNATLLGLQELKDDDLREMLREDDFDCDGALNHMYAASQRGRLPTRQAAKMNCDRKAGGSPRSNPSLTLKGSNRITLVQVDGSAPTQIRRNADARVTSASRWVT